MEISKIVVYLLYSALIGLASYFIAKSIKKDRIKNGKYHERSLAIQDFFIRFPWLISIIAFIVFLILNWTNN